VGQLSFIDKIAFGINSVIALLLLLACAAPYITAESFSVLSLLSLTVPILVLVNFLFLLYWLLRKKRPFFLSFVALISGYFFLGPFFKFKFSEEVIVEEDLSIMSFNTRAFNKYDWIDNPKIGDQIIDFVTEQNPDMVCFQEFDYTRVKDLPQYPYHYVNYIFPDENRVVQAIFSKYPIIANGSLNFPDSHNNAVYADVVYKKDTIRLYNLHLESLRIKPNTETITNEPSAKLFKRLSKSFSKQQKQAKLFNTHQKGSSYKKIICGDFNNTRFSNVYRMVKGELQDTFDKQGTGYGRTYDFKYFPVRIDFIMVDKTFEVKAHKNFDVRLSDHFPVMVSIQLKKQ